MVRLVSASQMHPLRSDVNDFGFLLGNVQVPSVLRQASLQRSGHCGGGAIS